MATGDHYASYADIQGVLKNSNLGASGGTLYDDTSLEMALDLSLAVIHNYLGIDTATKIEGVIDVEICRLIQIDLVRNVIMNSRFMRDNQVTGVGDAVTLWQSSPWELLPNHMRMLDKIQTETHGKAVVYNTRTGYKIWP